jgi:hypothetical protein
MTSPPSVCFTPPPPWPPPGVARQAPSIHPRTHACPPNPPISHHPFLFLTSSILPTTAHHANLPCRRRSRRGSSHSGGGRAAIALHHRDGGGGTGHAPHAPCCRCGFGPCGNWNGMEGGGLFGWERGGRGVECVLGATASAPEGARRWGLFNRPTDQAIHQPIQPTNRTNPTNQPTIPKHNAPRATPRTHPGGSCSGPRPSAAAASRRPSRAGARLDRRRGGARGGGGAVWIVGFWLTNVQRTHTHTHTHTGGCWWVV